MVGALGAEYVSHSFDHSDLARFKGRHVAVLGGGSSAIDTAVLVHEAGAQVELIARRDAIAFHKPMMEPRPLRQRLMLPRSGLGLGWRSRMSTDAPLLFHRLPGKLRVRAVQRHLGPAPGWFMRDRVVGQFPMHLASHITAASVDGGQVLLRIKQRGTESEQEVRVDHVIGATGFKVDLSRMGFLDPAVAKEVEIYSGMPVLSRNFESSVPGLYFVGLASANSFGPLTRFAFGAGFTAKRLSKHLAAQVSRHKSSVSEQVKAPAEMHGAV